MEKKFDEKDENLMVNEEETMNENLDYSQTYDYYNEANRKHMDGYAFKKKKRKPSFGATAGLVLASAALFGMCTGGTFAGTNFALNQMSHKGQSAVTEEQPVIEEVSTTPAQTTGMYDASAMAKSVMPSIVAITNESVETVQTWFSTYEQPVTSCGSGIIIGENDSELLVVTNYHVVKGSKTLTVAFANDDAANAIVKGYDADADIAVLAIKSSDISAETRKQIKIAALGDSNAVEVGDYAFAIGNAVGSGQSFTGGYISAVNREVQMDRDTQMTLIQTDAAINPGNSGGALLNVNGEVIGINVSKLVDNTVEGMGYAIPISDALPIIIELEQQETPSSNTEAFRDNGIDGDDLYGSYDQDDIDEFFKEFYGRDPGFSGNGGNSREEKKSGGAFLGITGKDITKDYADALSMPEGIYISTIQHGSPAASAGLKQGDIITAVDGEEMTSIRDLQQFIGEKKAGDEIEITINRQNDKGVYKEQKIKATLKEMPKQNNQR